MKTMKKALAAVLAVATLVAPVLTGCGGGMTAIDQSSDSVTVLNVNNYAGGFGSAWLDSVEKRFEAEYGG